MQIIIQEVKCPMCGAEEIHPNGKHVLIRAFKVEDKGHWYSECLVCAGFYDKNLNPRKGGRDPTKNGWF